jgi:aflatoxin B1 aldehyde reductase
VCSEGKIKSFGLSNYSMQQVVEIIDICKQNNYVLPTVYQVCHCNMQLYCWPATLLLVDSDLTWLAWQQGMYNAITRQIEEAVPVLRENGIALVVYNPLAGGLLTQRMVHNPTCSTRFAGDSFWASAYRARMFCSGGSWWQSCNRSLHVASANRCMRRCLVPQAT